MLQKIKKGQSLVELALILPILLIVVLGVIEASYVIWAYITVQNAAREAARYAVTGQPLDIQGEPWNDVVWNADKRLRVIKQVAKDAANGLPISAYAEDETAPAEFDTMTGKPQALGVRVKGQTANTVAAAKQSGTVDTGDPLHPGEKGLNVSVQVYYNVKFLDPLYAALFPDGLHLTGHVILQNEGINLALSGELPPFAPAQGGGQGGGGGQTVITATITVAPDPDNIPLDSDISISLNNHGKNTNYNLCLNGVYILGPIQTDGNGNKTVSYHVPFGTTLGTQSLTSHTFGCDPNAREAETTVIVTSSSGPVIGIVDLGHTPPHSWPDNSLVQLYIGSHTPNTSFTPFFNGVKMKKVDNTDCTVTTDGNGNYQNASFKCVIPDGTSAGSSVITTTETPTPYAVTVNDSVISLNAGTNLPDNITVIATLYGHALGHTYYVYYGNETVGYQNVGVCCGGNANVTVQPDGAQISFRIPAGDSGNYKIISLDRDTITTGETPPQRRRIAELDITVTPPTSPEIFVVGGYTWPAGSQIEINLRAHSPNIFYDATFEQFLINGTAYQTDPNGDTFNIFYQIPGGVPNNSVITSFLQGSTALYSATRVITVTSSPRVTIDGGDRHFPGETITIRLDGHAFNQFHDVYIDLDSDGTAETLIKANVLVDGSGNGGPIQYTIPLTVTPTGININEAHPIASKRNGNLVASKNLFVVPLDLEVTAITPPTDPQPGVDMPIALSVTNNSDVSVANIPFDNELYLNPSPVPTYAQTFPPGDQKIWINSLNPLETKIITPVVKVYNLGTYGLVGRTDTSNYVTEITETNNILAGSMTLACTVSPFNDTFQNGDADTPGSGVDWSLTPFGDATSVPLASLLQEPTELIAMHTIDNPGTLNLVLPTSGPDTIQSISQPVILEAEPAAAETGAYKAQPAVVRHDLLNPTSYFDAISPPGLGQISVAAIPLAATVDIRVSGDNDDAEEDDSNVSNCGISGSDGSMYRSSSDLELMDDGSAHQKIGMRFRGINIPPGSIINSAYIQFTSRSSPNIGNPNLTIYGQSIADAPGFSGSDCDISNRTKTGASQTWIPGNWTDSQTYNTPDLVSLVTEIIGVGGWASGNDMAFIVEGTAGRRRAWSHDGSSGNAPLLHIDYTPPAAGAIQLATGSITGVGNGWVTSPVLPYSYTSMVVIASVNYDNSKAPAVTRIRNATGNTFQVRVQAPHASNPNASLSGYTVYYTVVEEGVYTTAAHGVKMEAVKFTSTTTDRKNNWVGQSRTYQNSYSSPVVVGQVMTYNDSDWSVFWANGGSQNSAPSSGTLRVGKHVGEDGDTARSNETLGYIVVEAGSGQIEGTDYTTGVGSDIVRGMTNGPSWNYDLSAGITSLSGAVVSVAGMDGDDGGWPVLYGASPAAGTILKLSFDEDTVGDSERAHTTEPVAYFAFGSSVAIVYPPPTQCISTPALDLRNYTVSSYTSQDGSGTDQILENGVTLKLSGNAWREINYNYNVTANTWLEFDYRSSSQGEIQAIAFDNNTTASSSEYFRLYGTQSWGNTTYNNYASAPPPGVKHYAIPIGAYYIGNRRLTFANDNDANPTQSESLFSNVRVCDIGAPPASVVFSFSSSSYSVNEGGGSATITVNLDQSTSNTVQVNYTTADNQALAGSDYTAITGALVFNPGQTSKTFTVAIIDDSTTESDEILNLTLSSALPITNTSLGSPSTATLLIIDNDAITPPPPVPGGTCTNTTESGGVLTLCSNGSSITQSDDDNILGGAGYLFMHRTVDNYSFDMSVRLDSMSHTTGGLAGLEVRESTSGTAKKVTLAARHPITREVGAFNRATIGGAVNQVANWKDVGGALPTWLRIVRANGNFYFYYNTQDNTTPPVLGAWVLLGSVADTMNKNVQVGLINASTGGTLGKSTWQNFQINCLYASTAVCGVVTESDGTVVVNAVNYTDNIASPTVPSDQWIPDSETISSQSYGSMKYSGSTKYDELTTAFKNDHYTKAPVLEYSIDVEKSGDYYVWILGKLSDSQDSFHFGLNGSRITVMGDNGGGSGTDWFNTKSNGQALVVNLTQGTHIINIWAREASFEFVQMLLTTRLPGSGPGRFTPSSSPLTVYNQSECLVPIPVELPPKLSQCTQVLQNSSFEDKQNPIWVLPSAEGVIQKSPPYLDASGGSSSVRLPSGFLTSANEQKYPYAYQSFNMPDWIISGTTTARLRFYKAVDQQAWAAGGPGLASPNDYLYFVLRTSPNGNDLTTPIPLARGDDFPDLDPNAPQANNGDWKEFPKDNTLGLPTDTNGKPGLDVLNYFIGDPTGYAGTTLYAYFYAPNPATFRLDPLAASTHFYIDKVTLDVCTEQPSPPAQVGKGIIQGQLTVFTGGNFKRIQGVQVWAYAVNGPTQSTYSVNSPLGQPNYSFHNLAPGTYTIYAQFQDSDGVIYSVSQSVPVLADQTTTRDLILTIN